MMMASYLMMMMTNSQVCYQQLTAIANNVTDWSRVKFNFLDYSDLLSLHAFDCDGKCDKL